MSEFSFIQWIQSQQRPTPGVLVPAGDDMAVLKWRGDDLLLAAVDQVIDGVHFDSTMHTPRQIGRKVMNRNLSDCAAMGCLPAAALTCAALPRGAGEEYARELYLGMREAADKYNCEIVGGDTGSWNGKLVLSVTMLGRSAGVEPVLRSGAKSGDHVYVSGSLGGSILGRHMDFEPRVNLGRDFAKRRLAHAMIDISDGLSRDLRHICQQSKVGARINAAAIPIHADALALAARDGKPPLEHALHDGEDHELIIISPADLNLPRLGVITQDQRIVLLRDGTEQELAAGAWEHRL